MSSSKRQSVLPPPPKPPSSFSPNVVISEQSSFIGTRPISIGSSTVVHPRAKLNSSYAPIKIGSNCIISERSSIGLQSAASEDQSEGVVIENGVIVEAGAVVEAKTIREGSVVEINARIGKGAVIGRHCRIGAMCEVAEEEIIPDFTVIYGYGMRRIDQSGVEGLRTKNVSRQADVLRKLIPSNPAKFQ